MPVDNSRDLEQLEPGARDVARRLLGNGASFALVDVALSRIRRKGASGMFAIDAAAEALGRVVRLLPSPKRTGDPKAFAFVGPPGSGKTSCMLRLAQRMQEGGRSCLCSTIAMPDVQLPGGQHLGLDLPLIEVEDGSELERAVRRYGPDAFLLDTPGLSPKEPRPLATLGRDLRSLVTDQTLQLILTLDASAPRAELRSILSNFRSMAPAGVCLTHLNMAEKVVPAFEELARSRLPLAFLSVGTTPLDFCRPSADRVADLLLRGRLSRAEGGP